MYVKDLKDLLKDIPDDMIIQLKKENDTDNGIEIQELSDFDILFEKPKTKTRA